MSSKLPLSLASLFFLVPVVAGAADVLPKIGFRTAEHAKYDRIVFDAPQGFSYKYKRQGADVSIAFTRAAKLTFPKNKLGRAGGFALAQGAAGKGPLIVRFTVDPKAAVTHFKNDNSVVVDVQGKKLPVAVLKAAPKVKIKAVPKAKAPEAKISEPKKEAAPSKIKAKPEAKAAPVAVPKKEVKRAVVKVKGPVAPSPKAAPVKKVEETVVPKVKRTWPPKVRNPMRKADLKKIQRIISEVTLKPVAVFDPKIKVGAVVFERAGFVTILFDRKVSKDAFKELKKARVKLLPFATTYNVGYRIRVPENVGVRATRHNTAWKLYLVPKGSKPLLTTEFVAQPNFALGSRLLVPTGQAPKPVRITDPVVGDELLLIPFLEPGAFTVTRRLSDFKIIPSVQGLVIKPWHERVTARVVSDGIEITSEGGLKLSSKEDMGVLHSSASKKNGLERSLFNFKKWRGVEGQSFAKKTQKLWQTIVNIEKEKRVLARLDLARLYFAYGLGYESLSVLDVIHEDLPDIERHSDFMSLRGASRILVGRVKEGLADLKSPAVKQEPDISLWRAVGAALLQDWPTAVSLFRASVPMLSVYPEPMRSRFWILALESAIATDDQKDLVTWLSRLEKEGYSPMVKDAVPYIRAVLHSKAGRVDLAEKLWKKVADGDDRLYKIRAELALVDIGVVTESMTPKQATERLEGMRYSWRGDGLELDILKRLGSFYIENQDYREGFKTLYEVLRIFPDAPQTKQLYASMVKTFQDLFLTDLGKDLSPIESLSLYTDFQELIPEGEDGNLVRSDLAERLVNIDLLDQAVSLLEDLLQNARSSEDRVESALRIAGIRLLDHRADMALRVLDKYKAESFSLSTEAISEWRLLYSRALSEQGKYQEALDALPTDGLRQTMLLRADMALRARKWSDSVRALMSLVGEPAAGDAKLSEEQAGWLVHAAMAMARNADTIGLDKLAIDYGKSMDKTKKANIFRVLTRPDETTQLKDIKAAQSRLSEVDIFQGVLDTYRKKRTK